jgi:hypothetical protein
MRNGHRNLWTAEDDDHLRELIACNASPTLMSAKLKRSAEAIRMRIIVLRKRDMPLLAPSPRRRPTDQQIGPVSNDAIRGQNKILPGG